MIGAALAALFGGSLYLWYAGVRNLPEVKRRKSARRASRHLEREVLHETGARPGKERLSQTE